MSELSMNGNYTYQYGFSELFGEYLFDEGRQNQKAWKVLAVLQDFYGGTRSLSDLTLLDLGCSSGLMTNSYSTQFGRTVGIDIDEPAIQFAQQNFSSDKLEYYVRDAMHTHFAAESFDVVTCTHIYEHVPDPRKLVDEIYRLLKKGGVCYFAAQNRLCLIEPHYMLPLLSVIPKPLSHIYFRACGKGDRYYENLLTLGQLRKLVSNFRVHDFTLKVIADPERYYATDLLRPGSFKQEIALAVAKAAYYICPTYLWILEKQSHLC